MLKELEKSLGYEFKNIKNLENALIHSSYNQINIKDNERLEFLGDKVLGFIIADIIYSLYPKNDEGYLSKALSYFTSKNILFEIGKNLNTYKYIKHNTDKEESVIADSVEAIIAGIYMDSQDIATLRTFVQKHWDFYIKTYNEEKIYNLFNPKSNLQIWAQKNKLEIPKYIDVSKEGNEHEPVFCVAVEVQGFATEKGYGKSKKIAQKVAAQNFIDINKIT